MPSTPHECPHGHVRALGAISRIPQGWIADPALPNDGAECECGWCPGCEHYVWRELGSTYWTALARPLGR